MSCTLLLIVYYLYPYRNYFTSSNIKQNEYQRFAILWYKYGLFITWITGEQV